MTHLAAPVTGTFVGTREGPVHHANNFQFDGWFDEFEIELNFPTKECGATEYVPVKSSRELYSIVAVTTLNRGRGGMNAPLICNE